MKVLFQYQIHATLHEGVETTVYRGQTPTRQGSTILKLLKAEYPTLEAITRLKHEYQIRQNLDHPGIIKVLSLETFNHRLALLLEDFGGDSLAQLLQKEKLTITSCLSIAIRCWMRASCSFEAAAGLMRSVLAVIWLLKALIWLLI